MLSALEIAWIVWAVMGAGLAFMIALSVVLGLLKWSIGELYDRLT